jgi:hypothetical protein
MTWAWGGSASWSAGGRWGALFAERGRQPAPITKRGRCAAVPRLPKSSTTIRAKRDRRINFRANRDVSAVAVVPAAAAAIGSSTRQAGAIGGGRVLCGRYFM